jgi:glycosyltransferase involved in cell wall biosynthesis
VAETPQAGVRTRQLSVLHVLAPGRVGGLESVVRLLASEQRRAEQRVAVVTVVTKGAAAPHPLTVDLRRDGVEVAELGLGRRAYRAERRQIAEVARRWRADIVHTHGYRADVIGVLAARALRIPIVSTVHGFTGGDLKNRVFQWMQRRAYRYFDAVVAVSHPLRAELAAGGVSMSRLHLVRNAFKPDSELPSQLAARQALALPADCPVVGWVGRLSAEKGADVFLRSIAKLDRSEAWLAAILGGGPQEVALRELATTLGIAGRVRWCGVVPDAGKYFRAFDVFVLSSRTEGTPMVLFEAMNAGIPIVSTLVGGVSDVTGPRHALLVPSEDASAIASAISAVWREPVKARVRAVNASQRLNDEFDVGHWIHAYGDVYHSIARGESGALFA